MERYITLNTGAELFCFVVSLICLFKDKEPAWRLLVVFLFLTCLAEFGGVFLRLQLHKPNAPVYNIFLVAECVFQSYFFYYLYKTWVKRKTLLLVWLAIFFVCYFVELYSSNFQYYASNTATVLSVALTLGSVYYYYLMLRDDRYRRLAVDAPFWWVNATFCFYFAGIASNLFFQYLVKVPAQGMLHSARYIVISVLNIILYLTWSYSFLCRYRQRSSTSSSS